MNLKNLLPVRPSRRLRHRRTRPISAAAVRSEKLENRALLAGNVTAQMVGTSAFVTGDDAANSVEVLVESGNVIVRGQDGTTINGSDQDFILASGSIGTDLVVSMHGGNDTFIVNGVTVGRSATLVGGSGNDELALTNGSVIGGDLVMHGQGDDDSLAVLDSDVGRDVSIYGEHGNDLLMLDDANLGRNLFMVGASGADDLVIDGSIIGNDARLHGNRGADDVVLRDSVVQDDLTIRTHSNSDVVMLDDATVGDKSHIFTGSGADSVLIDGSTRFWDRLKVFGGGGRDSIEATANVIFDGFRRHSFRNFAVNDAVIQGRITDGALAAAQALSQKFGQELTLAVDNTSVSESGGDGAATLTVTRTGDNTSALEVTVASSNTNKLVPASTTVTIPAGQDSATVALNAVDNSTIDGDSTVTITASGAGINDATVDVTVLDNDRGDLTVTLSESQIDEDSGNQSTVGAPTGFTFDVTRTGSTTEALTVTLTNSDDSEISIPATVTIPAGQTSVTVQGQTFADGEAESNALVTITAAASGYESGADELTILDNDAARLTVTFSAPTVTETGSASEASVTVRRNTDTTDALTVTLTSGDTDSLTVVGTAVIPAGQESVTVSVFGVDEDIDDGDISVAVTAAASGFADGADTITVLDDDAAALGISLSEISVAEDAGSTALTATISRNTSDTSSPVDVTITVTGDDRLERITTATIAAGAESVDVVFGTIDNNVVDQPADGTATITVSATSFASAAANVTVTNDDSATINFSLNSFTVAEDGGNTASVLLNRTDGSSAETITLSSSHPNLISVPATVNFASGETSVSVPITVIDNDSFQANPTVVVTASGAGHADVTTTIGVTNDEVLTLTTDFSSNSTGDTVGSLVSRSNTFVVTGTTAPGATVQADNDGNGAFDEASTTADSNGNYTLNVPLVHDATNRGANQIQLRAVLPAESVSTTSQITDVHRAVGTIVRFQLNKDLDNNGSPDFFDAELLDADAPITVQNFLSYTTDTATGTERFDNLLVQRLDDDFIVQAGRYTVTGDTVVEVDRDADNDGSPDTIQNEFSSANSNLRGTLSMALPAGQPNGGSSEWFINISDNQFLDASNRLHTVFGRVIGDGMDVIDDVNDVPIFNLNSVLNEFALGETPLLNSLSGTVALTSGSNILTGTGTSFTTDLTVGDQILLEGGSSPVDVVAINSDTEVVLNTQASANGTGVRYRVAEVENDDFLFFSNIGEILDTI